MARRRRRSKPSALKSLLLNRVGFVSIVVLGFVLAAGENPRLLTFGVAIGALGVLATAVVWWLRRNRRPNGRTLGQLLALTPTQFEEAVASVLRDLGYRNVRRNGGSGDLGADLIGFDPSGRRVVVQCKRYAPGKTIGTPAIQPLYSTISLYKADKGLFVTTSGFTAPAVDLARRHGIDLIDGAKLTQLVARSGG